MTDLSGACASLERWGPHLFSLGAVLELVFALNNGLAFLLDGFSFVDWLYPTVLLGRAAVLLGIAGLSVRVTDRSPRIGKWSRIVLAVAFVFTLGLLSLSLLEIAGVTITWNSPIFAVFGLGTVTLTVITFALFGVLILRSGAFSTATGGLLLAAAVTVVGVFVGLNVLPSRLVGGVGEGVLFVLFLVTSLRLRTECMTTDRPEPASNTVAE
jgi:hypothetical protein